MNFSEDGNSIGEEETSIQGKLPELTDDPTFCIDTIGLYIFKKYTSSWCIVTPRLNDIHIFFFSFRWDDELRTRVPFLVYINRAHIRETTRNGCYL